MKRGAPETERDWESALNSVIDACVPIHKRRVVNKDTPFIVNMVGTVCILPQNQNARLPLEALAMHLGPCSQYAPYQFAANIIKFTNSITDSTALVFGSGRIVLVSALSEWHMRYMSQLFRLAIESVECASHDGIGNLQGYTVFERNVAHNVVGHGDFGFKVDLVALRDANPEAVQFIPDSFPAAKTNVWLTPDCKCHCESRPTGEIHTDAEDAEVRETMGKVMKNTKCPCTIKCLIFKTGRIVLIGARRPRDINAVFYRIMALVREFRDQRQKKQATDLYRRIGAVFVRKPPVQQQEQEEITEGDAVALAVAGAKNFKTRARKSSTSAAAAAVIATPLMRLCESAENCRLTQVQMLVEMDPNQVSIRDAHEQTALQRLESIPATHLTMEQRAVIDFLKQQQQQKQE